MYQQDLFSEDDYAQLDATINKKRMYKLADVKDQLVSVSFDVVRFKDADGLDKLWVVQQHNGEDVIVAMYEDEALEKAASLPWQAIPSKTAGNINVFYKGEPIAKFATTEVGLPSEEAHAVCRYLPKKLAEDKPFRASFLASLKNFEAIYKKYPELG